MPGLGLGLGAGRRAPVSVVFGAATRLGEGAAPVPLADGDYGNFTVSGGAMAPRTALTAGDYLLGGVPVTVLAGARTVATAAELEAIVAGTVTPAAGETVYLRAGSYDMEAADWSGHPSNVTFAGEGLPELTRWGWSQTPAIANVTLKQLHITRAPTITFDNFWGPTSSFQAALIQTGGQCGSLTGIVIEECLFDGQMPTAAEGGEAVANVLAADFTHSGIADVTLRRCRFTRMMSGLLLGCSDFLVEDCTVSQVHADAIALQNAHQHCQDGVIRNLHFTGLAGNPTGFHSDVVQFQPSDNDNWIRRITLEGITATPGAILPFSEVNGTSEVVSLTTDTVLDITHHARELRVAPADGTTLTLTLPSAAASEGLQFCIRRTNGGTGQVVIAFDGADGWSGGVPAIAAAGNAASFVSDGTGTWTRLKPGRRAWWAERTASLTLGAAEEEIVILADASAGDVTLTLPATGAAQFNLQRVDGSVHAVTLAAGAGDAISLHGATQSAVTLAQGQGISVARADDGDWTGTEAGPTMQGVFANAHPRGFYEDITVAGCAMILTSPHGHTIEQNVPGSRVFANTFLNAVYAEADGDGVIGPFEANAPFALASITLSGPDARGWDNLTEGVLTLSGGARDKGTVAHALGMADRAPAPVPAGRSGVAAAALAASGAKGASVYWDFAAGTARAGLPAPQIVSSTPAPGAAAGTSTDIAVTFDQFVSAGTGSAVLRNVTDGLDAETFDAATGTGGGGGSLTFADDVLTVTPGTALTDGKTYALRLAAGAVLGHYGSGHAGIADDATLAFTADASLATTFTRTALDGTAHVQRSGAINGGVAYDRFTFGFRGRFATNGQSFYTLMDIDQSSDLPIYARSTGRLDIGHNSVGLVVADGAIPFGVDVTVLCTMDMREPSAATGAALYINGTAVALTESAWTQFNDWFQPSATTRVLGSQHADREMSGAVDFLWFAPGVALDLSDAAVRASFDPAQIGADGSGPIGTPPAIYMTGAAADWQAATNRGTLTGWSATGTF
ncbi:Ig-like domain-containing protein [Jannaschia seohaensis]|uniref:Ig-like domain-containing protein n=1 Tax=Jannaschia seohaensis TaxID=475081 RepID=A0A2Y9B8Y8_9RHOB|nr:Ig-like domain-containing protein [Jannaschia seohaensis]PWJ12891.1 Ig-like domain-containing protein [Jannaschia seohaensis]SSA50699.1 Ig-like domain-containing protein [Jannaschia seohaensis]